MNLQKQHEQLIGVYNQWIKVCDIYINKKETTHIDKLWWIDMKLRVQEKMIEADSTFLND